MSGSNSEHGPLQKALEAHHAALNSQHEMRAAANLRDQAVRDAISAGYSTKDIAAHIGVTQRRVQVMARNVASKEQS